MKKLLNKLNCSWGSILLVITAILASFFWLGFKIEPLTTPDSNFYLKLADQVEKFQLPDLAHRTPLVPVFIAIFKAFLGLKGVVAAQILLGAITIYVIYKILERISQNKALARLAALMLAFDPLVISHQTAIMSETLGLFFLMLFLWLHLQLLSNLTKKRLIITVINDCLLIMSRPIYIILPIGIYMYHLISSWWFKIKLKRRLILVAIAANCLFLIGYQSINYFQHDFFGMTDVSHINLLGKMVEYGYLDNFKNEATAPEDVKRIILAYQDNPEDKSPHSLLNKSHPEIHSSRVLMRILQPVNEYFLLNYPVDYVKKTAELIPQVIKATRGYYKSISYDKFRLIKAGIDKIYNEINELELIALTIWLFVLTQWYLIQKKIIGYQAGILLTGVIYTMVMISIFSYGAYARLRMPIEPLLNMMIIVPVVYWGLKILKYGKNE